MLFKFNCSKTLFSTDFRHISIILGCIDSPKRTIYPVLELIMSESAVFLNFFYCFHDSKIHFPKISTTEIFFKLITECE